MLGIFAGTLPLGNSIASLAQEAVPRQYLPIDASRGSETEGDRMASKDKGGAKSSKKAASQSLKEKRQAKKAKQAAKGK